MNENDINKLISPTVKALLVIKNANSEQWSSINPILLKGELGVENDTKLMKIGDGFNYYNDLEYINTPIEQLDQLVLNSFLKIINPDEGDLIVFGGNID